MTDVVHPADPPRRLRVTYVMLDTPLPVTSGYSQHCESLCRALAELVDLRIIALQSSGVAEARDQTLAAYRGHVITPRRGSVLRRAARQGIAALTGGNRWLSKYIGDPEFTRAALSLHLFEPDVVIAGHTALAEIAEALVIPFDRVIVEHHDPASVNFRARAAQARGTRRVQLLADAAMMRRAERRCADAFDQWAVSDEDADAITGLTGRRPTVVPNCISDGFFADVDRAEGTGGIPVMGFLGIYGYEPNIRAAERVMTIHDALAGVGVAQRVQLVGGGAPDALKAAADARPGVEMTGFVADLKPVMAGWTLMLAPLSAGTGTKVKVLQAFAMGIPVVTTSVGAQGLPIREEGLGVVADSDADLATACRHLLKHPEERAQYAARARRWAWDHVSETALRHLLEKVFAGYRLRLGL